MKRISNVLALIVLLCLGVLIAINWSTLMIQAPLNLVVAQIQAPLGLVMLGLAVFVVVLFLIAYLQSQVGSLLETRRLLKEVQRVQGVADKAESSRIENLHQLISTEFRLLNERIGVLAATERAPTAAVPATWVLPPVL